MLHYIMKLYLSSYKTGDNPQKLANLFTNTKVGYIPNALDFLQDKPERIQQHTEFDTNQLKDIGLIPEIVDLKHYFDKQEELSEKIKTLGGVWVSGGNTFVLLQAYKLSGFDTIIKNMTRNDFVYAGYSAGCCILSPSLKGLSIVDDPNQHPYPQMQETIWEGLGIIDYAFLPHYDSDHPESEDIDKEVEFCKKNNIHYKTIKDGKVFISV
jgi:dipeptidase E